MIPVEPAPDPLQAALDANVDLVIIDTAVDADRLQQVFHQFRNSRPNLPILLVSDQLADEHVVDLVLGKDVNNVLAKHSGVVASQDLIDETEFIATVQKILTNDLFGLEKYLTVSSVRIHEHTLTHTDDRKSTLDAISSFLQDIDCHRSLEPVIVAAADELLMNATFSAPRDAKGQPKYDDWPRTSSFKLEPNEHVQCRFACDGRQVLLSVTDRFGALDRGTIMRCLGAGLLGGKGVVQEKAGGAGLGLYMVVHSITQLVFNVHAGERTEVIAAFYIRNGMRGFRSAGQSLNLFLT